MEENISDSSTSLLIAHRSLGHCHGAGSGRTPRLCEDWQDQRNGAAHPSNPGRFGNMTRLPGHRNPIQMRAMTVKAVAVR